MNKLILILGFFIANTASAGYETGTANQVLIVPNAGGRPQFGQVDLSKTAAVKSTLPSANGGLGVASPTAHSLIIGNGSSPVNTLAPGAAGTSAYSNGTDFVAGPQEQIKNYLSNSAFDYWIRGTSVTIANAVSTYEADHWYVKNSLGTNGVITFSQVAGVTAGSKFGASVKITTAPTAAQVNGTELYQTLENLQTLNLLGQIASFGAQVKALGNVTTVGLQFYYKTSEAKVDTAIGSEFTCTVNSSTFTACALNAQTLTSGTITSSGVVGVRIRILGVSSGNTYDLNNGFVVEQAQVNLGSILGVYSRQFPNPKDELHDALRWYAAIPGFIEGYDIGTATPGGYIPYPAPFRVVPSLTMSCSSSSNITTGTITTQVSTTYGLAYHIASITSTGVFFCVLSITGDASI